MLVALFSLKGSPGVTSTALALAATWPRPVVLVEADPAGGDLAYRCRAATGGPAGGRKSLLTLAATVRRGTPHPGAMVEEAQQLGCGVALVQGVATAGQSRGLAGLWPMIAQACVDAQVDVLADLGRLDPASPVAPLVVSAEHLLPVASTSLESALHLRDGLDDTLQGLGVHRTMRTSPLLVGTDARADRDCADLAELLAETQYASLATQPVPYDPRSLHRLEQGGAGIGWLRRAPLLRAAGVISGSLMPASPAESAAGAAAAPGDWGSP